MVERVDAGHDRKLRPTVLVPVVFISLALLFPLVLLVLEFEPERISSVVAENVGVLRFTFFQASLSTLITLAFGIPLARIFARRELPKILERILKVSSKVPFVVPGISMALGFFMMFGRRGLINTLLSPLGLRLNLLYSFKAILMGHVFYNIPVVLYVVGTLWERLDRSVLESAMMDGAREKDLFLKIELPILIPSILSASIMVFTYCFTSFAVVLILGGVRYSTLEVSIYTYLKILLDFKSALGLTLFQTAFLTALTFIRYSLERSKIPFESGTPLRERMKPCDWIYLIFVSFMITAPLIMAILGGFMDRESWRFSFEGFERLLKGTWNSILGMSVSEVLIDTFIIALLSALISTTVATFSGKASVRVSAKVSVLSYLPSTISTASLAFGYVLLSLHIPLPETIYISLLHSVISLPMAHMILESAWRGVDRSLEEMAMVDGAGELSVFLHVQLPALISAVLRSFTLSMAISMSDLVGVLTLSRKTFTLSGAVYRLFSSRHVPEAMALNSILMILVFVVLSVGEMNRD